MKYSHLSLHLLFFFFLITFLSCSKEKSAGEPAEGTVSTNESGAGKATAVFSIPQLDPDYWKDIYELQQQVMQAPDNIAIRKSLCERSYFEPNRAIVVVGVGRRTNPNTGEQISLGLVRQAAYSDAARWASYISTWLEHDYQPNFGEISTALNSSSEVIKEMLVGDSLYVELAYNY